jgi:hypothetical protein
MVSLALASPLLEMVYLEQANMEAFISFVLILVSIFWDDVLFDTKLCNNGLCTCLDVEAGYCIHYLIFFVFLAPWTILYFAFLLHNMVEKYWYLILLIVFWNSYHTSGSFS